MIAPREERKDKQLLEPAGYMRPYITLETIFIQQILLLVSTDLVAKSLPVYISHVVFKLHVL